MLNAHIMLWLIAIIWGFAFVAESAGAQALEPYSFNSAKFVLAILTLIPLLFIFPHKQIYQTRKLLGYGIFLGLFLFAGFTFQQTGLMYVTAGDAGFISSTYIVIIPIIAMLFGQKIPLTTWTGILVTIAGLYQLSVGPDFSIEKGDVIELIGAFFWACHVLLIGYYAKQLPVIPLAITQFSTAAILSIIMAFTFESPKLSNYLTEWIPILYVSIVGFGFASILQILAQKTVPASISGLIISMSAVFAVFSDWLFMGVIPTYNTYIGSSLILAGMLITQAPSIKRVTNSTKNNFKSNEQNDKDKT